ncbi:DUF2158 domain-containing protein [Hymenobacter mellowenesis]|uniref:DUF2158 domain-containing protein n=1 Tax=Hymenobacter mellowenesis TaxID=3063995 RepID=UPI00350FF95E
MASAILHLAGDKVQLTTGGPALVVLNAAYGNTQDCQCAWFTKEGEYRTALIPHMALQAAKAGGMSWS